jgi:hypothetical protein
MAKTTADPQNSQALLLLLRGIHLKQSGPSENMMKMLYLGNRSAIILQYYNHNSRFITLLYRCGAYSYKATLFQKRRFTDYQLSSRKILLRGIQRYWGTTVNMVFSFKIFTFHEANTCVALPNAWRRSVRALS